MKSLSSIGVGDQCIDVFDVSTNILSRVEWRDHVCCGRLCKRVRMQFTSVCATIGFGVLSKPMGKSNSFVESNDIVFSDEILVVMA